MLHLSHWLALSRACRSQRPLKGMIITRSAHSGARSLTYAALAPRGRAWCHSQARIETRSRRACQPHPTVAPGVTARRGLKLIEEQPVLIICTSRLVSQPGED